MAAVFLITASEAVAIIAELMPVLIGILFLGAVLYAVAIWVFLEKKSPLWRLFGFALVALFMLFGIQVMMSPGNEWGIMNSVFFFPILFGLVTEYLLRKRQRVA